MFGRCHSVPVKEVYTYDVSPSVVQRFRMLLEKLSNRGTHTHTHTHSHTHTHTHTHTKLCTHIHKFTHSHIHTLIYYSNRLPTHTSAGPKGLPQVKAFFFPSSVHGSALMSKNSPLSASLFPGMRAENNTSPPRKIDSEDVFCEVSNHLYVCVCVCVCAFYRVVGPAVTFQVLPNTQNVTTADVVNIYIISVGAPILTVRCCCVFGLQGSKINQIPTKYSQTESTKFLILTVVSILCIVGVLLASTVVYCLRHRSHHKLKEKLTNLGTDTGSDSTATYQELCRQRMAVKPPAERPEPISSRINSVSSQFSDGGPAVSPSARSSTSSWCEEPAHSNMDISTGHMILSYMEDHLKNKDRLEKEWEALCAYQAEPNACTVGLKDGNAKKNRSSAVVAYDHSRITLKVENSQGNSDYINASPIMDHDPRNPAYIATQGPLPSTVADFWQMVWENGCVVIVMLTPLVESGVKQCYHYWPDEGSNLYHIYEVNLVSEHIWCDDFLVRSFYLKNMQTNETRTVTQFHFLTWLNQNVPETSRTLLDFRRKVNKCYRGRSCPIIVHCSDGAGRSGTYVLIDMVLNKMAKGAKEIDIAATLEHLRDQRPGMVQTKDQFEFALTAVAEEVNAILKALPQ
uniref:Protein tyrosine phosphatase receptor type N2 n=1 Tax=Myripristis murdjan TaxID=586833 RepID=A0A668AGZ1_9TELE